MDITKRNLNDRESERQEFIRKIETLKEENDTLSLQSERDKAKIDGVIMFCKLIENGSLSRSELQDRIYEIPNLITTYLLGETNNFNFSCDSPKRRSESPSRSDDSDNKRTWNTGPPGEEITEIKGRVEKIYDMLSKILPNANEENILQHLDQDNTATTKSTTSRISESPIESKTPNTSMLFSDTNKAGKLDKEKLEAGKIFVFG